MPNAIHPAIETRTIVSSIGGWMRAGPPSETPLDRVAPLAFSGTQVKIMDSGAAKEL